MLDFKNFECTGCTACFSVCPKNAIKMIDDEEGFKRPEINESLCVNCDLCRKVCIPSNGYVPYPFEAIAFGVKNKNLNERKQSQSGGVFFVLAKRVIEDGGVVYGAYLDEFLVVKHGRAVAADELKKFRGSKYVQSDLGDIFSMVKTDLAAGVKVLFSGTPCQVAGLKAFLGKNYDNLIAVDLICHGVPSPKVYKDYLSWQIEKNRKTISGVDFRDVTLSWGKHVERLTFENGVKKQYDVLARLFYSHNVLRKSCYECHFANVKRVGDITIGDFWGVENVNACFKDNYGVSAVIVNSERGLRVWDCVKDEFEYFSCRVEDLITRNPNLQKPSQRPNSRDCFWNDYKKGFNFIAKKYGGYNLKGKVKKFAKLILKGSRF